MTLEEWEVLRARAWVAGFEHALQLRAAYRMHYAVHRSHPSTGAPDDPESTAAQAVHLFERAHPRPECPHPLDMRQHRRHPRAGIDLPSDAIQTGCCACDRWIE